MFLSPQSRPRLRAGILGALGCLSLLLISAAMQADDNAAEHERAAIVRERYAPTQDDYRELDKQARAMVAYDLLTKGGHPHDQ